MVETPEVWLLSVLVAVAIVGIGATLWDLSRHEVRHLPKWVWALIIVLVTFPIGVLVYLVVGRLPDVGSVADEHRTPPPHVGPSMRTVDDGGNGARRPSSVPSGPPALATSAVSKVYGDNVALDRVDLEVPRGTTYGLIGPNGAGKTTLLSILAGLRHPSSGEVHLDVPRRRIAVLVDTPLFEPWLTAYEVVDLARHLVAPDLPPEQVEAALTEVGLADAAGRRTGGFSRGMLQRLGLATCLVGEPEVLMLDEPSSALDPAGRREVLDLVGRLSRSTTVLLSTHILSDVQQVCDVVGVIDAGRLRFQGPLSDLLASTSSVYSLHVRPPIDGLRETLTAEPWLESVEELAPGRMRLIINDAAQGERRVPRLIADHGLALVSFNPATDLETAFLELTR
jgi:ABC-2 type transport system ATP-binding protein